MRKKILAVLTAAVMTFGLLAGCGSSSDTGGTAGGTAVGESTDSGGAEASEDTKHIVVTWVYYTVAAPDLQEVTDAVNAITIPKINVEVEFEPISLNDTYAKYATYIASGEGIDCMLLLFQNPLQYYNNGSVEPLNELLEQYGPTISALAEEYPITASVDGEVYGFAPVDQYYGTQPCIYLKGDYVEAAGDLISADAEHVYSTEELTAIFAAIKEAFPEVYPFNTVGNAITASQLSSGFASGIQYDIMGGSFGTGVLMGTDSTEIVNYFETEEYYNYLKTVKEWYDAGYILPDAVTTDSTNTDLLNSGVSATALTEYNPIVYADQIGNMGEGCIPLKTAAPYYQSKAAGIVTWTIPVTSKEPEAAMKFYDLLYSDVELANLVMWGLEGKHYVKTETEQVITFPDGVDATTSGYYNTFGVWGDRRDQYVWTELATKAPNAEYTGKTMANPTKAGIGNYQYNNTNTVNTVANIDTVIKRYAPALECGAVSDLDATYKEFINALKVAGIDEVIADNQAQFDEYLATIE